MEMKTTINKVIYVGPSLSRGRLFHGQIFLNGLPQAVQELCLVHPWFRYLLVPTSEYVASVKQIGKKGTPLHLYFNEAKEV